MTNQKIENIIKHYKYSLKTFNSEDFYTNCKVYSVCDIQDILITQLEKTLTFTQSKIYTKHISDMLVSLKRNYLTSMEKTKYTTKQYTYFYCDKYIYQILVNLYCAYFLHSATIPDRLFSDMIYF